MLAAEKRYHRRSDTREMGMEEVGKKIKTPNKSNRCTDA